MRWSLLTVAALSIAGLAFAAGNAAPKVKLKFPWASESQNTPCHKTKLEWQCATKGVRRDKPVQLGHYWDVVRLEAKPGPKRLVVLADLRPRKVKRPIALNRLSVPSSQLLLLIRDRFSDVKVPNHPFRGYGAVEIRIAVNGKHRATMRGNALRRVDLTSLPSQGQAGRHPAVAQCIMPPYVTATTQ